jgi:hypothetical protein
MLRNFCLLEMGVDHMGALKIVVQRHHQLGRFTLGVKANVQPKSNIESICAEVEFSLEGFKIESRL